MRDPRHVLIAALHREGHSIRAIARRVDLSRSRVHEIVTAQTNGDDGDPDPWTDDDAEELALFDAEDDDPGVVPPITYVGTERVWCPGAKGEGGRWADQKRYLDCTGRSVSELDLYRWCEYRANDHDDRDGAAAVRADLARQIEAAEAG